MKRTTAALALIFALAACSDGPAGPGTLVVELDAPVAIGAVQMRVVGEGITSIRPLGGTEIASRLVQSTEVEDRYMVIAFAPDGGGIRVGVDVESTDLVPEVIALDAAAMDGVRVGVAGIEVRVGR